MTKKGRPPITEGERGISTMVRLSRADREWLQAHTTREEPTMSAVLRGLVRKAINGK